MSSQSDGSHLSNLRQTLRTVTPYYVCVMHTRRGQDPDSRGPENVDRRRGFLDIVERLGQGVVAVTLTETDARNYSDDQVTDRPRRSTTRRTHRP